MGVPSHVGSTSVALTTAGTGPMTISTHGSVADGDLELLWIGVASGAGVPSISGNPFTVIGFYARGYLLARLASSEPGSYDITLSLSSEAVAIMETLRPSSGSWSSLADAIASLAWRNNTTSSGSPAVAEIPIVATDHRAIAFMSHGRGTITLTEPSGYTLGSNPDSGGTASGSVEAMSAHKSVTGATSPATSFTAGTNSTSQTVHVAVVDPGNGARALRSARSTVQTVANTSASFEYGLTGSGDRAVLVFLKNGTAITPPAGWTAAADVQWNTTNDRYAVFTKDATLAGTELGTTTSAFTFTSSTWIGWMLVFRNSGPVVIAHAIDTTSNTAMDVPALTMAAQSPGAIVVAIGVQNRGDHNVTAAGTPAGYSALHSRDSLGNESGVIASGGGSGDVRAAAAYDVTTGSNPAAVAFTSDTSSQPHVGIHIGTTDVPAASGYGYPVLSIG